VESELVVYNLPYLLPCTQHTSLGISCPFADMRDVTREPRLWMATIRPRIRTRDFAYLSNVPFSLTDSSTSHPFSCPFAARSPQKVGSDPVVSKSGTKKLRGKPSAKCIAFRIVKTKIAKIVQENDGDLNGFSVLPAKRRSDTFRTRYSMILFVPDTPLRVGTGKPRTWTTTYEHRRVPSWSHAPLFILHFAFQLAG
jgi:hypothetical protein